MANTTFEGPVRSKGGFVHVSVNATTGAETETTIVNSSGVLVAAVDTNEPLQYSTGTGITAGTTQTQAGATALTEEWNNVTTCATDGDGVALPTAVAGLAITVKNSGAASLAVYPATSDAINAMAVNLSVNIPPGGMLTFRAIDATTWETSEVLTLNSPSTQKGELIVKAADQAGDTVLTVTNASQAQASTWSIPDVGATGTFAALQGAQTFTGAKTFSGGLVGDVNGVSMATAAGSGVAGAAAINSEITKQGKLITTHLFVDIEGLVSSTTLADIIGDNDAANAYIGLYLSSESGQIISASMSCLEVPAGGVVDVDLYAAVESTGAEDADVTALTTPVQIINSNGNWTLGRTVAAGEGNYPDGTSDYLYLSVGVAGTPGTYTAGQFLIELIGYEA